MRVLVLLNPRSGTAIGADGRGRESVERSLAEAGVETVVTEGRGTDLMFAARQAVAAGVDAVVAAGGDGTVSTVASVMAGSAVPMGILPLGTLNHFAKDLGLPLDLPGAAAVIAAGRWSPVDVGEVNGRVFVNNSSIGLYPHGVRVRDQYIERLGKWPATVWAMMRSFARFPTVAVRVKLGPETLIRRTPFVFVGNNRYQMHLFSLGSRSAVNCGELSVYLTKRTGRIGVLLLALRALVGRLSDAKDFEYFCTSEVEVDARRPVLDVAADGEVCPMRVPLRYRILPGRLRMLLPPKQG